MKRLLLSFFALLSYCAAQSQATQLWCENFDGATVSATSAGVPGWSLDTNYFTSSPTCFRGQYQSGGGVVTLTSPVFNTTGLNFVLLDFRQICKIEFTDKAQLQYSLDGVNWTTFDAVVGSPTQNVVYNGNISFQNNLNSFSEATYFDWAAGTTTAPSATWWKSETFDVSMSLGNQPTVQIRFIMTDVVFGLSGRYGWLLDDICVTAAPCELFPPTSGAPYPGQTLWQGDIYNNLGPFDVWVWANDPSGIAHPAIGPGFTELVYAVNGGAPTSEFMFNIFDSAFAATIPAGVVGDTICWHFDAYDNSGCNNLTRYPASGEICFILKGPVSIPFCDNFEIAGNLWTVDPNSIGTGWVNGVPTGPVLATAHAGANVYGVGDLGGVASYLPNTSSAIFSPDFDFTTVPVANLSFWQNRDAQEFSDGARIEYSLDGGANWTVLGTLADPNATNWYTNDFINSSSLPAWDGTSNGWIESKYKLGTVPGIGGSSSVIFKYVFTSNGFTEDAGFHIDDFCITIPCADDIGAIAITSPIPGSGQPAGATMNVTAQIENFGQLDQSGFNIGWSLGGAVQPSIPFTGTLALGTTASFTIPNTLVLPTSYEVCVWTELTGDCSNLNDTVCATFIGIPTIVPSPFFCDDFESGNIGWSASLSPGGDPGTNWEFGTPAFGQTTGANGGSANAWDINLTTQYTDDADCDLYSPYFDFSNIGAGSIQFWFNYDTEATWDGVRLEFTNNNGNTWTTIGSGNDINPDPCGVNWYTDDALNSSLTFAWEGTSNGWKGSSYKLCCTSGIFNNPNQIQFRFKFTSDPSVLGDGFSLDDFCIYAASGDDIGITSVSNQPFVGGAPVGQSVPVIVTLENFGATTVTSAQITYTVNGSNPVTITWNGSLPPCGVTTVVLPNFNVIQGPNVVCAFTSLPTDANPSNDTSCANIIGQPILTPTYIASYSDDFESGNIGWAPSILPGGNLACIWEFGTPNFGVTTGAYNSNTCWDVNLTSGMVGNANTVVTTPYFDFGQADKAILRFYQNRALYEFGDQMYIEYAVNNGAWTLLQPSFQQVTNWYNQIGSWDDLSNGWVQSVFKDVTSAVGGFVPLVQFRFVCRSTNFTTGDGVSVDNFEIFVPIPLSVQTTAVNTSVPCQFIFPGQPITFASPIKNNGVNAVFNHNITLVIDGNIVSVDPVTYLPSGLAPDSTKTHNFNNTWVATSGFHSVCVYTDSPNGSTDLYQFDDTSCATILVFDSVTTSQLPFCTSFESGNQWVTSNSFTYCAGGLWQQGTPSKPNLNGAHTGNTAWTTNLSANYANKDSSGLFSSLFRVEAGHCYQLSFWQQFRMEYGSDGGALDYSTDYGATWNRLDMTGTPNITLFGASPNYTYVSELDPSDPNLKGFTGYRNSWFKSEKTFRPDADAQLVVRWRFASDYSATDEGWSIDDVCFVDLGLCSPVGIDEFAINDFGMSQNYPNPAGLNTTFEYMIPSQGQVRIVMHDMIGQVVSVIADQNMAAGKHTVQFITASFAPGLYTYTLVYEGQQITKRMIITR